MPFLCGAPHPKKNPGSALVKMVMSGRTVLDNQTFDEQKDVPLWGHPFEMVFQYFYYFVELKITTTVLDLDKLNQK